MDSNGTNAQNTSRDILGPLAACFYALFTILPDSSSLVLSWPWVFVWQVALLLPWLWLIRDGWLQQHFTKLGYKLDYGLGLATLGLVGSTLLAQFPQQARWYSWAAFCVIAALYALNAWCSSPERRLKLLKAQGYLTVAFITVSLGLWVSQTLLPELNRLKNLKTAGLNLSYDFSTLELRNWAPIGHQNYVAGYLVLGLPLLLGLVLISKTKMRWFWGLGALLGLVDLYTTSSRGGWLGTAVVGASGGLLLLGHRRMPSRFRWMVGLGLVVGLGGILLANNRLRSLFSPTSLDSAGGETAFRLITNATGWAMGLAHPFFGAGAGSVPLLYQSYRPAWAGREAELVYQLHGTPAQLWAEFGGFGIALSIAIVGWLGYWGIRLWSAQPLALEGNDRILTWSLLAGFAGYGVVSITDYQLDIVCISGTLVIYSVSLLSLLRQYVPSNPEANVVKTSRIAWFCWGMVGLLLAVGLWLAPIHRAWQLSSLGFGALGQKQIEPFQKYLEQAHQLAPWEPYYSYQLGWNLSKATSEDPKVNRARFSESLDFFKRNVKASPHQESGSSSLGWLQMFSRQPASATASFFESTHLVPAKRGGFHSLGVSLLGQGQTDLGVQAIALEIIRDPLWLTSPLWRSAQYAPLYPQVQAAVVQAYQKLLQNRPQQDSLTAYFHQCLGGVYWWQGNLGEADREWSASERYIHEQAGKLIKAGMGTSVSGAYISRQALNLAQQKSAFVSKPGYGWVPPGEMILKAWLDPKSRQQWIERALLNATQTQPDPKQVQAIQVGMSQSKSFDQWVKQNAPPRQFPRERAGFGVLSRHIDGPAPTDFFPMIENTAMSQFLTELLPSPDYSPDLDKALQPLREKLWISIVPATKSKL
jgi:uncharacterized protein involved in response to NO